VLKYRHAKFRFFEHQSQSITDSLFTDLYSVFKKFIYSRKENIYICLQKVLTQHNFAFNFMSPANKYSGPSVNHNNWFHENHR
jgi:hypothetical protein